MSKKALILGAGGFIGSHMARHLTGLGYWVRGVDLKHPEFSPSAAQDFVIGDLRDVSVVRWSLEDPNGKPFDEIYQFAADMGGAGFIFTGDNDADIMHNSASINLNVLDGARAQTATGHTARIFYSSSACIYPERNQMDPDNPMCREDSAYPADPDSEYGWEKLFSERMYLAYSRNYGIPVRIARYHNVFGPEGTWQGGREKAPAAICRKVAELPQSGGEIEIWGDGKQTRSFLYIDECIEATYRLTQSDFTGPVNIGSEEMVTIDQLVDMALEAAGRTATKVYDTNRPQGVRGRNSDNALLRAELGWEASKPLADGVAATYEWIAGQMRRQAAGGPAESHTAA